MVSTAFPTAYSDSLFQRLDARLDILLAKIVTADSATAVGWLEEVYLLVSLLCLGVPLLSLLAAACMHLTSSAVGREWPQVRTCLGLPGSRRSARGADLLQKLQAARETLPRSLVLLLLFGLVPVLGTLIGVLYYRLSPIPALGRGVERSTLGPLRWLLPIFAVALVGLQPLPVIGPLCLPLLYAIFQSVYDSALRQQMGFQAGPSPEATS